MPLQGCQYRAVAEKYLENWENLEILNTQHKSSSGRSLESTELEIDMLLSWDTKLGIFGKNVCMQYIKKKKKSITLKEKTHSWSERLEIHLYLYLHVAVVQTLLWEQEILCSRDDCCMMLHGLTDALHKSMGCAWVSQGLAQLQGPPWLLIQNHLDFSASSRHIPDPWFCGPVILPLGVKNDKAGLYYQ